MNAKHIFCHVPKSDDDCTILHVFRFDDGLALADGFGLRRVTPENFPSLNVSDHKTREDNALMFHFELIESGVPESLVEEIIAKAGFDVTRA
jgi:hypothetical protein